MLQKIITKIPKITMAWESSESWELGIGALRELGELGVYLLLEKTSSTFAKQIMKTVGKNSEEYCNCHHGSLILS